MYATILRHYWQKNVKYEKKHAGEKPFTRD